MAETETERLATAARRMNEAAERANGLVKNAEDYMDKCGVGITMSVKKEGFAMMYSRFGGRFRITACTGDDVQKPWSDLSRAEKIETLSLLPVLMSRILALAENEADRLEKAVEKVAQETRAWL